MEPPSSPTPFSDGMPSGRQSGRRSGREGEKPPVPRQSNHGRSSTEKYREPQGTLKNARTSPHTGKFQVYVAKKRDAEQDAAMQ